MLRPPATGVYLGLTPVVRTAIGETARPRAPRAFLAKGDEVLQTADRQSACGRLERQRHRARLLPQR